VGSGEPSFGYSSASALGRGCCPCSCVYWLVSSCCSDPRAYCLTIGDLPKEMTIAMVKATYSYHGFLGSPDAKSVNHTDTNTPSRPQSVFRSGGLSLGYFSRPVRCFLTWKWFLNISFCSLYTETGVHCLRAYDLILRQSTSTCDCCFFRAWGISLGALGGGFSGVVTVDCPVSVGLHGRAESQVWGCLTREPRLHLLDGW
jgi:hypothetical protein